LKQVKVRGLFKLSIFGDFLTLSQAGEPVAGKDENRTHTNDFNFSRIVCFLSSEVFGFFKEA
jgi:hypothetical protein